MFNEYTKFHAIYITTLQAIDLVTDFNVKNDSKEIMLAAIDYVENEYDILTDTLYAIDRVYCSAILYAASPICSKNFIKLYCNHDDTDINSIGDFCIEFAKEISPMMKASPFPISYIENLFKKWDIPKTKTLLELIQDRMLIQNNLSHELNMCLKFIRDNSEK